MKLHKVLLFGFLLLQPGWLLANTSWAELSPSQQRTLSYYAPYWHKLHHVQKKRLLRAANSSLRADIASHSIKRNRHGHFKGYSGLHHKKKAIRHGLRGNIGIHFGAKHHAHKRQPNYRHVIPKQRYKHGKRWGRYSRKYHH